MGSIGEKPGFDLGAQARDWMATLQDGIGDAAKRVGLDGPLSALERLLATPSPLDRLTARQPAEAAPPRAQPEPHTVRARDTLGEIAASHGMSTRELARLNGIADPNRIRVGQQIVFGPARATQPASTAPAPTAERPAAGEARLSENGLQFLYEREAQAGVSNRLHWPKGASGVTLGPGYDMKGRAAADIVRDLTAVGVDRAAAERAAGGAGLSGAAARDFAANNRDAVNLSAAQERQLLERTVAPYVAHVREAITAPVSQNQFDAMVSFAYNIGLGPKGFDGSTALRRLNAGDHAGVPAAMELWNKSGGQVNQGLINRRGLEVELFNAPSGPAATTAATRSEAPAAAPRGDTSPAGLAAVIERSGDAQARADLAAGRKVVVALRTPTDADANGGKGRYDDTIAVVWKDAGGTLHAQQFRGNTEPSGQYSSEGPKAARGSSVDLNGDGRNDLGRLQAGTMRYTRESGTFLGNTFFRADRTQVAERDTNGDGVFDARDGNRVDRSGAGRSMLIHQGGASNTWSAGCQTIASADFNRFVDALGGQRSFSYVLVDAQ